MKTLIVLILLFLIGFCCAKTSYYPASTAFNPNWEGELNPHEIIDWPRIKEKKLGPSFYGAIALNPDPEAEVKKVCIFFTKKQVRSGLPGGRVALVVHDILKYYGYLKEREIYGFFYDERRTTYRRFSFTEVQKRSCLNCHQRKQRTIKPRMIPPLPPFRSG